MNDRIAHRRQAAQERIRRELTDPMFNLREITKQLVLLEDHLAHPYKVCQDCIRKHLLTIEAFAEEGSAMAVNGESLVVKLSEGLAEIARLWMTRIADGEALKPIGNEVRTLRKKIMPAVYDPRGPVEKVASRFMERCPHRG